MVVALIAVVVCPGFSVLFDGAGDAPMANAALTRRTTPHAATIARRQNAGGFSLEESDAAGTGSVEDAASGSCGVEAASPGSRDEVPGGMDGSVGWVIERSPTRGGSTRHAAAQRERSGSILTES
jgi:hypothetical protein